MRYNRITTCDICNGNGIGVVLWCQGCDLHCSNCHNPLTWDFNRGEIFTSQTKDLIMSELDKPYITRLTLSGGHPLAPDNLTTCTRLCKDIKEKYPDKDIWVYTGYVYEDIKDYEILKYIDILVDGPYIDEQRDITLPWRGSRNQRVIDIKQSIKQDKAVLYCE